MNPWLMVFRHLAISVQRTELSKMQQGHGEPIRSFYCRVRGKAINCKFQVECTSLMWILHRIVIFTLAICVLTYVSPDAVGFYLSREAMVQLGIVPYDFPSVGKTAASIHSEPNQVDIEPYDVCKCPKWTLPPGSPSQLPFLCSPENIDKMETWLLDRYSASTFNVCPHQLLPEMDGPPVEIHVDPHAKPIAAIVPSQVPLHWQDEVCNDIRRDESLSVIEKVPYGEPSPWCHQMVIARKG